MEIWFGKMWGQHEHRWNFCGGPWNYKYLADFVDFYGLNDLKILHWYDYEDEFGKQHISPEYSGIATKNLELINS